MTLKGTSRKKTDFLKSLLSPWKVEPHVLISGPRISAEKLEDGKWYVFLLPRKRVVSIEGWRIRNWRPDWFKGNTVLARADNYLFTVRGYEFYECNPIVPPF